MFDDGAAAYDMACNGHGIVWAPEWLALDDLRDGRVVEVLRAWRSGEMRLRWTAAGMLEDEKQFRRLRGHREMPLLVAALAREVRPTAQAATVRVG